MDTKKKIRRMASKLFVEQGFDNTPMSQIANELGLSKAGLYHHYASKENLLYSIISDCTENNFYPWYEKAKEINDPEKRLSFFLNRFAEMLANDPMARIVVHEARRLKPHHMKKAQEVWKMTYDFIKDAVTEIQETGKGKKLNSSFAAFAAIGMYTWIIHWFDHSRKKSWEELSATFDEIFLRGICIENA